MFSFEELSVVKKGRRSQKKAAALNCLIKGTNYFIINPFFLYGSVKKPIVMI